MALVARLLLIPLLLLRCIVLLLLRIGWRSRAVGVCGCDGAVVGCGAVRRSLGNVRRSAGRLRVSSRLRFAVVLVVGELRVFGGLLACSHLRGHWARVGLMHCRDLRGARLNVDAAVASVVADAVGGPSTVVHIVDHDVVLVDVVNVGDVYVRDRAVVVEVMPVPVAAKVAEADVAKAVIDTAVKAHMWAPVAAVEHVMVP